MARSSGGGHQERCTAPGPASSTRPAASRHQRGEVKAGDIVIIRYEGPKGGPGMQEMLGVTAAIVGQGLGDDVALVTDGRFSGASHGHGRSRSPPRRGVGPIALLRVGTKCHSRHPGPPAQRQAHRGELTDAAPLAPLPPNYTTGALAKYAKLASSASEGAVTR
ncbi:Dihydroxy-acid dehydratase [Geodia barretti]|uniref:Dihydroxy-acid dehydratase n=1 Tax=Geodia barretti TaxID=519541 RepID=A0AA35TL78_GEOBA|nr:Dihydroxy-acid dehydratase [Geodia barretti]